MEYLRAKNMMRAFDVGQEIVKQGNEIINIKITSSDDSPLTINEIEQSLVIEDHWTKEHTKTGKTLHSS